MADDWGNLYGDTAESGSPTWGDYGRAVKSGAEQLGAGAGAATRWAGEANENPVLAAAGKYVQQYLNDASDDDIKNMTPAARERIEAAVTDQKFWSHPLSASMLKGAQMTPMMAAALLPGGLIGDAAGAVAFGGMNMADSVNNLYGITDKKSDADLRKDFPYYDQLRSTGMDEDDARQQANASLRGWKPAINFAVGAVAGALGPIAGAARAVTGRASALGGEGIVDRALAGGVEGATAMGAQGGVENITQQQAQIQAGSQKDFDKDALVSAVLGNAIMGGAPGALLGAAFKGHAAERADGNKAAEQPAEDVTAPANINPAPKSYGTGNAAPVREDVEVGNPQSAPTRSERNYKTDTTQATEKDVLPTQPATPDVTQQAAAEAGVPTNQKAPDANTLAKALFAQQEKARAAEAAQRPVEQAPAAPVSPPPEAQPNAPAPAPVARPEPAPVQPRDPYVAAVDLVRQAGVASPSFVQRKLGLPYKDAVQIFERMRQDGVIGEPDQRGKSPVLTVEQPKVDNAAPEVAKPVEPAQPVTQQGNAEPEKPVQPTGRVLKPIDKESKNVVAAQNRAIAQNIKGAAEPADQAAGSRSHKSKAQQEAKAATETNAQQIIERHAPASGEDDAAVLARAKSMVDEAQQNGVKIPAVLKGQPSPAMTVLREANDLVKASNTKKWNPDSKYRAERYSRFRTREAAARGGAVDEAIAERRAEGDTAKRVAQKDVNEVAEPEVITGARAGETKQAPIVGSETKVGDSELRGVSAGTEVVNGVERAKAASEVRKPQLSDEEKAKYAAIANKYAPKTAEVKARIDAAAAKADTNPTPAQKAAGNYEKGHVSIHGLDVTIENPRGSIRKGVGPDGKEWSVKMPDHYGYIKRTEGADGDHVDTFVGPHPESPHAFVVDQVNADTRAFDEHKVLLGYRNAKQAMDAYEDAFSDGRAAERVGGFQAMTVPALKEWLRGNTTKPLEAALRKEAPVEAPKTIQDGTIRSTNGQAATPLKSYKLRDILPKFDFKGYGPLFPFIRSKLMEGAGNVDVHLLADEDMTRLGGGETNGLYHQGADGKWVALNSDIDNRDTAVHTIVHEAVHALTVNGIERDPRLKGQIRALMDSVIKDGRINPEAYAFKNEREFIAEAWGNREFQDLLRKTKISESLGNALGLKDWRSYSLWSAFVDTVRRIIGLPSNTYSALEATIALTERASAEHLPMDAARADMNRRLMKTIPSQERLIKGAVDGVRDAAGALAAHPVDAIANGFKRMADRPGVTGALRSWANKLTTSDQYRQKVEASDPEMGAHAKRIFDAIEKQGVLANELKKPGTQLTADLIRAERQSPEDFAEFSRLMNDETMYGVDASAKIGEGRNSYLQLSKENLRKQAKGTLKPSDVNSAHFSAHGAYKELADRYREIASKHPDWADLHERVFNFFHDAQQEMAHGHIDEFLRAAGVDVDGRSQLARQILQAKPSDDFRELLKTSLGGPISEQIFAAKKLAGKDGPYVPLMRHGDYVVGGKYKVEEPTNAVRKVDDSTWEFKTRQEAHAFGEKADLPYTASTVYYDPLTGERTTKVGGISQAGGPEQRWEVKVQRQHTSFHDTEAEAKAEAKRLHESGLFEAEPYVNEKKDYFSRENEISGGALQKIVTGLQRSDEFQRATPAQQAEMLKSLRDAAIATRAGNKVQSRRLPRRKVAGASDDLPRNMWIYNESQANYRAKIKFRPQIEEMLQDMHKFVTENRYDSRQALDPRTLERSKIANEVESRARAEDPNEYTGTYTNWARRIQTWSYIDRMMRPSHLILHQTHLPMITVPAMAGRHGALNAYATMARTWRRAVRAYKAGASDTIGSALDGLHEGTDYQKFMKQSFAGDPDGARVGQMFDALAEIGVIHPQSGIEIGKFQPSRQIGGVMGKVDNVLQRMDTVFRHATNATEAINRYVGAATAYRLEFDKLTAKGMDEAAAHDKAVDYARNTVANTQGYYTPTNAAPLFKNKALRPFLQFKQFPQMMYHLLIQNAVRTFKGATREERVQAAASLMAVLGAHTAMTGLLGGLPLEAGKIGGLITKGLGVTQGDWNDVERAEYEKAVDLFGKDAADYIMHGVARHLFGVDVHHRLGLNSFFTFGLPDKVDATHVTSWLFDQALGAPEGLVQDTAQGVSKMMGGDIMGGAAKAFPSQALRDVLRAYNGGPDNGKYKYTPGETAARLLGFTPAGEARQGERAAEMNQERTAFTDQRNALIKSWVTGNDKSGAWKAIQQFNTQYPQAAQITMSQLHQAATRAKNPSRTYNGVSVNKQTQWIADRDRSLYPQ